MLMDFMDLLFCTTTFTMPTQTLIAKEKALIIGMHQSNMKSLDIAKNLGMPQSTISIFLSKEKVSGCMATQKLSNEASF